MKYRVTVEGRSFEIEVDHDRLVWVHGHPMYVDLEQVGGLPVYSLALDDKGYVLFVEEGQGEYRVEVQGQVYPVQVSSQRPRLASRSVKCSGDGKDCLTINAPLAGDLVGLPVTTGEQVAAGQTVAIVESMKMQMKLKAPRASLVQSVHGPPGRTVIQGEELVVLRPTE
jgi:biotin carboxyl carrier protein